jgi:hypothetical protein
VTVSIRFGPETVSLETRIAPKRLECQDSWVRFHCTIWGDHCQTWYVSIYDVTVSQRVDTVTSIVVILRLMINVTKIIETCGGCPSQWNGRTDDGQYLYVRYRWGFLRVALGLSVMVELDGDDIYGEQIGDGLDGVMDFGELTQRLGHLLDFSKAEWVASRQELYKEH